MNAIIAIAVTVLKNIAAMFVGKTMVFWALEVAAGQTDTAVDDNIVGLIKAGYNNDAEGIRKHAEAILAAYRSEH